MRERVWLLVLNHKAEVCLAAVSCVCTVIAVVYLSMVGSVDARQEVEFTSVSRGSGGTGGSRGPRESRGSGQTGGSSGSGGSGGVGAHADEEVWIDVSGAVQIPGTYALAPGSRIADAIKKAGGLSATADTDYFYRNYNNARIIEDQEKIYVPRIDETQQGVFVEGTYYIDHSLARGQAQGTANGDAAVGAGAGGTANSGDSSGSGVTSSGQGIGINSASQKELEELQGVGEVTAKKIIDNRPYTTLDELVSKKSVGQSLFDKIKGSINLN